jgi:hypothetical protein
MLAIFGAGFAATWVKARNDKSACEKTSHPAAATSARVQRTDTDRLCVWLDRQGRTVQQTTLP